MKKKLGVLLVLMLMFVLSGCIRMEESITENVDGSYTVYALMGIQKEYADGDTSDMELRTIDGVEYYVQEETQTYKSTEDIMSDSSGMVIGHGIFMYNGGEDTSMEEFNGLINGFFLTISFTEPIVDTNGTLLDEKTVQFNAVDTVSSTYWYAYTQSGKDVVENDITPPVISGVAKNKYYKKAPTITVKDNVGVKEVKLNNKAFDEFSQFKEGKNTIVATDFKGNSSSITFYYDTKVPVFKGVKNGKVYRSKVTVYVKDKVALKILKDNGKKMNLKKVKSGKYKGYSKVTIKKKGKHKLVAQDKAGNKKTIKITVK